MSKKILVSWSTGKDSAWTLHLLKQDLNVEIVGLFCTVNKVFNRVTMHGVRVELLQQQADSLGLPLHIIEIPFPCSDDKYKHAMIRFAHKAREEKIDVFAFGDIFLEDVRKYREDLLKETGITPIFPLWECSTKILSRQMITGGLKAIVTCLDPKYLGSEFIGREYNAAFLQDIPGHIDPNGENGEFHSFVYDGSMFKFPIKIALGETVYRDGFYFKDLLPCN